jgi:hypothetical protein
MQCTINFVNNPLKVYKPGGTVELLIELQVNETVNVEGFKKPIKIFFFKNYTKIEK